MNDTARGALLMAAVAGGLAFVAPTPRPAPTPAPPVVQAPVAAPTVAPTPRPVVRRVAKPRPQAKRERPRPQQKAKQQAKQQPRRASLPSCSTIRAQYERMTWPQRLAAYRSATPEQIAHGRRCLGQ